MKLNSSFKKSSIRNPHVLAKIGLLLEEEKNKNKTKQIVVHLAE
jgi:hypothetical protein